MFSDPSLNDETLQIFLTPSSTAAPSLVEAKQISRSPKSTKSHQHNNHGYYSTTPPILVVINIDNELIESEGS